MSTSMTLEEARQTVRDFWNIDAEEDFSHLRPGEYEQVIVRAYKVLEEEGDGFDVVCAQTLYERCPSIFDWDENGNFVAGE